MGRIFPDKTCSTIAGYFHRDIAPLTKLRAIFACGQKLPIGKLALAAAIFAAPLGSLTPAIFAQGKAKIAAPGEPVLKAPKTKPARLKPLKTRGKKKRKYKRLKKRPLITPDQQKAAELKKTRKQKKQEQAQKPFEAKKIRFRASLGIAYHQVATTGEHFRNATVEPGVYMEASYALSPIDTSTGGGATLLGVQLASINGATVYDDVFFRYSYNYLGPSVSYRYFMSGERQPAAGEAATALTWSYGGKAAVMMVKPLQSPQSNAKDEELEFGGQKSLRFDAPGLLIELNVSYHFNNALALEVAGGQLLATEKTYTYFLLSAVGTL